MNNSLQKEINVFFLDGTEEYLNDKDLVLCYGGFFPSLSLKEFVQVVNNKKIDLRLQEWMPIKWNFSDDLKRFYKKNWEYFDNLTNFEDWWNQFKNRSLEIRVEIMKEIRQYISIIISVWTQEIAIPNYKKRIKTMKKSINRIKDSKKILAEYFLEQSIKEKERIHKWLHERVFSRIGLNMDPSFINFLMCDYEHYRSENRSLLLNEYFKAYHKGERFFSGPLKNKGAFPDLAFGHDYFNVGLQIADIIVGCINSLVKSWRLNRAPKKEAIEVFLAFKDSFIKKPKTDIIFGYGLKVEPENFRSFLEQNKLL